MKEIRFTVFFLLSSLMLIPSLYANDQGVAKVIIVRGKVVASLSGATSKITKGMWLKEGTSIQTAKKSFIKLLFLDKSQMNMGPESKLVITKFPKKKAGIITLMKGQLRSKVTKDYMNNTEKNKSKLFIKTKSAAMGVRGTDFQVNFNPENANTSLVTFSGAVAMVQLDHSVDLSSLTSNAKLETMVSSDSAVIVKKGQYSGASPTLRRVTIPIKISPAQLEVLKKNDGQEQLKSTGNEAATSAPKKAFRSPIPPGVSSKTFANESKELDKALEKAVGKEAAKTMISNTAKEIKMEQKNEPAGPPPEGLVNKSTGAIAPTAGGFIDLKTAQYVPPPKGSTYDPVTKVYIPPPQMGGFDAKTGGYVNKSFELTSDGKFIPKKIEAPAERKVSMGTDPNKKGNPQDGGATRAPASSENKPKEDGPDSKGPGAPGSVAGSPAVGPDGATAPPMGDAPLNGPGEEPPPPPPMELSLIPSVDGAQFEGPDTGGDLIIEGPVSSNQNNKNNDPSKSPASVVGPNGAPGPAGGPDGEPGPDGALGPGEDGAPPPEGEFGDFPPLDDLIDEAQENIGDEVQEDFENEQESIDQSTKVRFIFN